MVTFNGHAPETLFTWDLIPSIDAKWLLNTDIAMKNIRNNNHLGSFENSVVHRVLGTKIWSSIEWVEIMAPLVWVGMANEEIDCWKDFGNRVESCGIQFVFFRVGYILRNFD